MKILVHIFALIVTWTSGIAYANYQNYEALYTSNSDEFRMAHYRVESASGRYNLIWPYDNEPEKLGFWNYSFEHGTGDNFRFNKVSVGHSIKFSKRFSLDTHLGAFQFQNQPLDTSTITTSYGTHATFMKTEKLLFYTSLDRSFLIEEGALSTKVSAPIWALSAKQVLVWRSSAKWKHDASYRHRWIEDDNSRDDIEFSSLFGVSVYPKWIMIGGAGSYTTFKERSALYWSPKSVSMIGLKFDLAMPFREQFAFKLGGVIGPAKEAGASTTVSDYVKAAIAYGSRETRNCEFYFIDSRSTRADGEWSAQTIGLSYFSNF